MGKEETIPEGNAEKGAKVFKQKCAQCHTVTKVSSKEKLWYKSSFLIALVSQFDMANCFKLHWKYVCSC